MDYQTLFNIGAGALLTVAGWFLRELWDAVQKLRTDLSKLREEVAKDYVSDGDFRTAFKDLRDEMRENFTRLFDKLDKKADK